MKRITLFASGSGTNVENIYNHFKNNPEIIIDSVYTNNPNAFVIERCKNLGINCFVFNRDNFYNSQELLNKLNSSEIDLIVLAGFLWLIPNYLIDSYPNKIINIHPALLPKYGGKGMYGMNVHKAVKEHNEPKSGVTIHFVNNEYDKGDIIEQHEVDLLPTDSAEDIANKIHKLEYEFFPKAIAKVLELNN